MQNCAKQFRQHQANNDDILKIAYTILKGGWGVLGVNKQLFLCHLLQGFVISKYKLFRNKEVTSYNALISKGNFIFLEKVCFNNKLPNVKSKFIIAT